MPLKDEVNQMIDLNYPESVHSRLTVISIPGFVFRLPSSLIWGRRVLEDLIPWDRSHDIGTYIC